MDDIVDSEQLAELESLLYSQIHHSMDEEPMLPNIPSCPKPSSENTPGRPRYYGIKVPSTSKESETLQTDVAVAAGGANVTTTARFADATPTVHIRQEINFKMPECQPMNRIPIIPPLQSIHNSISCTQEKGRPDYGAIQFVTPVVALDENLSKNQRKHLRRRLRKQQEALIQKAISDAETFKQLDNMDRKRVMKLQKRHAYLARRKERQKLQKEQELTEKFNNATENTARTLLPTKGVIELSETDEDEIVAIEPVCDTVLVSSDDEVQPIKTEKVSLSIVDEDDNSVQFVETPVEEPIVLDLEPDVHVNESQKTDAELMKPPSDETTSLSSAASAQSNDKNAPFSPKKSLRLMNKRVTEVMNTPESSNDFLDNSLDVSDKNFNFSLHGNELCAEKSFIKPRTLAEAFESESSCSASDISSVKNHVFNELEFESPAKSLFGEADLGTFSDFITPKRKSSMGTSVLTPNTSQNQSDSQSKETASETLQSRNESDSKSSSESDFEDECVKLPNTADKPKRKRLPSLSHFEMPDESKKSNPLANTTKNLPKKVSKAQNKFDFIKDALEESPKQVCDSPKVCEKKNKKRKQKNTESEDTDHVTNEVEPKLGSAKKKKKQKKLESQTIQEKSSDKSSSDKDSDEALTNLEMNKDVEKSETDNNDLDDPKEGRSRKRMRKRSAKSKSDTEVEKNVLKTPRIHKNSTKSDSEIEDHDNAKKIKKKKGNKSDTEGGFNKNNPQESGADDIDVSTTPQPKRKRSNKSESNQNLNADPQVVQDSTLLGRLDIGINTETENVVTPNSKKRKHTKSDNESTDNSTKPKKAANTTTMENILQDNSEKEEEACVRSISPNKRKKRLRSNSNVNDQEVSKEVVYDSVGAKDVEDLDAVDEVLNATSDVEFIETPIEIIDISDGSDEGGDDKVPLVKSSSEDELFNRQELDDLKTDLDLSNVAEAAWDVHDVDDAAIVYDTVENDTNVKDKEARHHSWFIPGYDADKVRRTLPDDPSRWKIMERDRVHIPIVERGPRCNKCREFGHIAFNCDRKQTRCWLCGQVGHQEPRCPNTMCTNCGRSTRFFTSNCGRCQDVANNKCSYCDCRGHPRYLCPDVWRRYYLTTDSNNFVLPHFKMQHVLKPNKERWCSGCSKSGHLEHMCNYYNRTHRAIVPFIYKHEDVYKKINVQRKLQAEVEALKAVVANEGRNHMDNILNQDESTMVGHREMGISFEMDVKTTQIFVAKGMSMAKELFEDLHVTHTFRVYGENGTLHLQGFPTDLMNVQMIMKEFIRDPTITKLDVLLSNRDWLALGARNDLLKNLERQFRVVTKSTTINKSVRLTGGVFNMLLAENYLHQTLAKGSRTKINKQAPCVETFVLSKLWVANVRNHPRMNVLADKYSITWNLHDNVLSLAGIKKNVNMMKHAMGEFQSTRSHPTLNLLRQINSIIAQSEYAYNGNDGLFELLKEDRLQLLNVLLFTGPDGDPFSKLPQLQNLHRLLSENVFLSRKGKRHIDASVELIKFFKLKRSHQTYVDLIKSRAQAKEKSSNVMDLYSLGASPEKQPASCFFVKIQPGHTEHLLNTARGSDFLNELNADCPMELKRDESTLYLYCDEAQKEAAMNHLNFYFFILNQPFPKLASAICSYVVGRLAQAKLDYYTTSASSLLAEARRADNDAEKYEKLNGLLFAKYELLDGRTHKEELTSLLTAIIQKNIICDASSEYRKVKTAALHLFCTQALSVDYDYLVSIAVPPVLALVLESEYGETLASVQNGIQRAREKYSKPWNIWKMAELRVLNEYLLNNANSRQSVGVACAFIKDNFLAANVIELDEAP